ncbi:MAG: hypothetical protein ABI472_00715 [Ginsengibacter sp.]
MKKFICVCLAAFISATSIFAAPAPVVTEKVLKVFHDAFPEVKQPTWYSFEGYYEVFFTNPDNNMSCRIDYSPDGEVLSTTRYYTEPDLSPVIRAKIYEKYPGKKIFGITEVSNSEKIEYHIVLEDNKYWYNIESNATGDIRLEKKLTKAD